MKINIKRSLIIGLILILSIGCNKKDDEITSGEIIAKQIIDITKKENITRASVYELKYYDGIPYLLHDANEEFFEISNTFLIINKKYYNLEKLIKFEIAIYDDYKIIELYF